jgi:omega-hydroxy-beta-dihydromenaquinone-9 sulfotransferase
METAWSKGWRFWHNVLSGISLPEWRRLLRENRYAVDPVYAHRAAYVTMMAVLNTVAGRKEERLYGAAIEETRVTEPPLFVLGHWRSGTTHLHNLLCLDTEQFAYPNSVQTTWPHSFLCTEEAVRRVDGRIPRSRPMDEVAISLDAPQEDEWALMLRTLHSPYLHAFSFPRHEARYAPYLTWRGAPEGELQHWQKTFVWYLKKLTLKHGRALVLKSPTHTARVRLLLETFPDARFVHLYREPYAVFRSTCHLWETLPPLHHLQRPRRLVDEEGILRRYQEMYDAYFEERALIPDGRLHELRYEALEADPVGEVAAIYERLGLPGFAGVEPKLRAYAAATSGYRKNRHVELSPERRRRIGEAWRRNFEAWGYSLG